MKHVCIQVYFLTTGKRRTYFQSIKSTLNPEPIRFRPGDSTINQLLYITQKIYTAFEDFPSLKTRAVFLDISKAFDKVWHEGLVFKLKTYGISGPPLALIVAYLSNRQQRMVLKRKTSVWSYI